MSKINMIVEVGTTGDARTGELNGTLVAVGMN